MDWRALQEWEDITEHIGMIGANGRYCLYDASTVGNGKVMGSVNQNGMVIYLGYRVVWIRPGVFRIERSKGL